MPLIFADWLKSNQNLKFVRYLGSRYFKRTAYHRHRKSNTHFATLLKNVSNNIFRNKWTTRHQRPLRNVLFARKTQSDVARPWMTKLVMFSHQSTIWMIWRSCLFAFFGFPGRAAPRNVNVFIENWARNFKKQPFNIWKVYCLYFVQLTHSRQKTCIKQKQTGQTCRKGLSQVLISGAK